MNTFLGRPYFFSFIDYEAFLVYPLYAVCSRQGRKVICRGWSPFHLSCFFAEICRWVPSSRSHWSPRAWGTPSTAGARGSKTGGTTRSSCGMVHSRRGRSAPSTRPSTRLTTRLTRCARCRGLCRRRPWTRRWLWSLSTTTRRSLTWSKIFDTLSYWG